MRVFNIRRALLLLELKFMVALFVRLRAIIDGHTILWGWNVEDYSSVRRSHICLKRRRCNGRLSE
jgi:hypothetical protein